MDSWVSSVDSQAVLVIVAIAVAILLGILLYRINAFDSMFSG